MLYYNNNNISDEYLNSFVDNQLDAAEKMQAYEAIRKDDKLKIQVCELRSLKDLVQQSYAQPPAYKNKAVNRARFPTKYLQPLAACLLIFLGGASGWLTHAWLTSESNHKTATILQNSQLDDSIAESRKVILHLGNSNPVRFKTVLDEAESLLNNYKRNNKQLQVEVITNKGGVDLLRMDASTYKERIALMQAKFPNLRFLVCGQTISKLRNKGKNVQLLPRTEIASSAAEQINKRVLQGWDYVKI